MRDSTNLRARCSRGQRPNDKIISMTSNRRAFLRQAALAAAAASTAANRAHAGTVAHTSTVPPNAVSHESPLASERAARTLDASLLAALGDAVLPESLGVAGRARAVAAFSTWLAGYAPVSEEMHGYGNQEITYTPSDPAPGWAAQLTGMDLLAQRKHAHGFASLDVATRRDLVRAQLARQRTAALPANPLAAPHVVIALMAHWAGSSGATDVAYGVRINKENCRVLGDSPRRPLPLASGGRS